MKIKKIFTLLMAALVLSSCGGNDKSDDNVKKENNNVANSESSDVEYELNLGDVLSEEHPHSKSFYYFADKVKEYTNGKVKVNVFVNSTLGNQSDLTEGLSLGTVQIAKTMSTVLSTYNPEIQIFDVPYLFKNEDHFFEVVDGHIGQELAKEALAKNDLVGIGYFYAGKRSVYSNKDINSIDDLKGMKLRVPEAPIYQDMCKSWGASGVTMSVGELYTSLQTGVVDGAENAPIFYENQKHYEAAPYFIQTEHVIAPDIVVMSKSYLESMPKEYQDAIEKAAKEMVDYERKLWKDTEEETISKLKEKGVTFKEIDKTPFIEASKQIREQYKDIVGEDKLKEIDKLGEKY